jgi:hypothetical protein
MAEQSGETDAGAAFLRGVVDVEHSHRFGTAFLAGFFRGGEPFAGIWAQRCSAAGEIRSSQIDCDFSSVGEIKPVVNEFSYRINSRPLQPKTQINAPNFSLRRTKLTSA